MCHRSRYRRQFRAEMEAVRKLNDELNREAVKLKKAVESSFSERERVSNQYGKETASLQAEVERLKHKLAQASRQVGFHH